MDSYFISENDDVINIINDDDDQKVEISEDVVNINETLDDVKITVVDDSVSVIDSIDRVTISDGTDDVNISFEGGISQTTIINQTISEDDVPYKFEEIDFENEDVIYKGWSNGSSVDESLWRIQKITFINDEGDIEKRYANNSHDFIHLWANRAIYNY